MCSRSVLLVAVTGALLLSGVVGVRLSALPWIRDMYSSPAVLPYERPMTPPLGSLPVNGPQILSRMQARDSLTNPLRVTPEALDAGERLYGIYCGMCHGGTGAGDGMVAEYFRRVPDLNASYIQGYTDGSIYSILRLRGFNMPSYADALSVEERWALVHYVRTFGND